MHVVTRAVTTTIVRTSHMEKTITICGAAARNRRYAKQGIEDPLVIL